MRVLASISLLLMALFSAPLALAQVEGYVPGLGDIMTTIQMRHIKLWFAGRLKNWDLATYELEQIRQGLEDAATLYTGIPAEYVGATVDPIREIDAAIKAKDGAKFVKGYGALTSACNGCHQGINRGFIVIQVPNTSPFSDQSFAPPTTR
jgi:hypothetical protein